MNAIIAKQGKQLIGTRYLPAVSIILPFEPKMSPKAEVEYRLKIALGKVEKELMQNYSAEKVIPVINKLHQIARGLNFNTHKKSIAIFVSPLVEKVFYLDLYVEEKIVVDESFEFRDLVKSKKQIIQYLILLLSGKSSKMYLGKCSKFILIKSNISDYFHNNERNMPEIVTPNSDQRINEEILVDKFLHHMDDGLSLILNAYPLPVFVIGEQGVLGHFKKTTKNERSIVHYVQGNCEEVTESEIREAMKPFVADWRKIKQQAAIQEIEKAMNENKLVYGIKEVCQASTHKNSRLLIVEKDFRYPVQQGSRANGIHKDDLNMNIRFYIKDSIDGVMEKILVGGGDVEFVDNDILKDYGHIALIRYN
jgi:Bacterial archaeo-eukaryotic release factor family 3